LIRGTYTTALLSGVYVAENANSVAILEHFT
jgi:hypothetical protein